MLIFGSNIYTLHGLSIFICFSGSKMQQKKKRKPPLSYSYHSEEKIVIYTHKAIQKLQMSRKYIYTHNDDKIRQYNT